ncbi:conserved hypothetical protein [Planktothrix serta PCC 8927]|uniref:CRISPR type III-associated protein domain-containing protein n=1 Tax=Planktothrix serta PCC 8927 TaxID=671068 RepID=A0A7Z9C2A7_9CYAN|nr:TIGR03986 family CRISPR-associated RAMP protein [Planktothrix serta]VXD25831.1 conserved hypothetical protein [Planktothrix serta PCC 8927]
MNPRHIDNITDPKRRAIAPYNFVELPEKVVEAERPLPEGDRYHLNRHTGRIECILTTESPLYTRCGLTTDEFESGKESKDLPEFFYTDPSSKSKKPVIPGSSLRGMLRTLVEIVSFSKIERVSGHQRLFFRAVGSNPSKESWGKEYKQYVKPEIVKAGYLKQDGQKWYIQPATEDESVTFAWVEESELANLPRFKRFNSDGYEPQYFDVSYNSLEQKEVKKNGRVIAKPWFASNINLQESEPISKLVTSGNMKQADEDSPRRNHCIVFPESKSAKPLPIDDTAIEHYRNALTEFQKESPFDKDWGVLEEGHPVFYYHDGQSKTVGFFGQSPNFRIPYSPEGNGHATTVLDFIPKNLRKLASIDLADAIFGWIKQESENERLPDGFDKQRSSRIFVTDALYESNQNGIFYSETPVTPQILSEPKPSYFPHYLVQPNADQLKLKHYASEPLEETVIRGHKLYWHKGDDPDFELPASPTKRVINSSRKIIHSSEENLNTQTTQIEPIKKGVTFKFDVYFENLSDVELGALLWVLSLSSDKSQQLVTGKKNEKYCFSLGMGKPLGMGAVKIDYNLHLSDRTSRYSNLFDGDQWKTGEENQAETAKREKECVKAFEDFMFDSEKGISDKDRERPDKTKATSFKETRRIEMLLAMLRCDQTPDAEQTRYMTIKAKEYQNRPVLPTPLQISKPSGTDGSASNTPKLILQGQNKDKQITKDQPSKQQQKPKGNSEGGNSAAWARPPKR